MNNQELLNSLPLEEAAKVISNEMIKIKTKVEEMSESLERDKKTYQADYIAANDGDASENAPLDRARENLRFVTGEILSNKKMIQRLESLEDVEYLVGTYNFKDIRDAYSKLEGNSKATADILFGITDTDTLVDVFKKFEPDDLFNKVIEFERYCDSTESASDKTFLMAVHDFYLCCSKPRYNSCGIIVPYTTVRLELNGVTMTYRIYPKGISFLDVGVLSASSRVGEALLGKVKGDRVTISHSSKRRALVYNIVDIY